MKPRSYATGAPPGHYTLAERPLTAVLQRMDAETVSGLLEALRAALVAHDALIDELDLLVLPPPTDAHLWDTAKAAFLRSLLRRRVASYGECQGWFRRAATL